MSCCYCITRVRSITACVDCSLQAKTVLSNSIFLHYTFFSLPKACVSHRCSSYTNIIHVQQAAVAQGLSAPHTKWGGHGNLTNSSWLCPVPHQTNLPSKLSLAPFLPQTCTSPGAQGEGVGAAGYNSSFSEGQNCGSPERARLEGSTGLTWCHLPASRAMPEHRMAARQLWNASSEGDSTPSLCPTSAAPSTALIFWGHC